VCEIPCSQLQMSQYSTLENIAKCCPLTTIAAIFFKLSSLTFYWYACYRRTINGTLTFGVYFNCNCNSNTCEKGKWSTRLLMQPSATLPPGGPGGIRVAGRPPLLTIYGLWVHRSGSTTGPASVVTISTRPSWPAARSRGASARNSGSRN
jgi:hypothetical protein